MSLGWRDRFRAETAPTGARDRLTYHTSLSPNTRGKIWEKHARVQQQPENAYARQWSDDETRARSDFATRRPGSPGTAETALPVPGANTFVAKRGGTGRGGTFEIQLQTGRVVVRRHLCR